MKKQKSTLLLKKIYSVVFFGKLIVPRISVKKQIPVLIKNSLLFEKINVLKTVKVKFYWGISIFFFSKYDVQTKNYKSIFQQNS